MKQFPSAPVGFVRALFSCQHAGCDISDAAYAGCTVQIPWLMLTAACADPVTVHGADAGGRTRARARDGVVTQWGGRSLLSHSHTHSLSLALSLSLSLSLSHTHNRFPRRARR